MDAENVVKIIEQSISYIEALERDLKDYREGLQFNIKKLKGGQDESEQGVKV